MKELGLEGIDPLQEVLEEEGGEPCNSLPQIFMTSGRQALENPVVQTMDKNKAGEVFMVEGEM